MYPTLSPDLIPPEEFGIDLEKLWKDLVREILERDYSKRTHGHRRTYDVGCRGPACSKASREYVRRRSATLPSEYFRFYEAIVDEWFPVAISEADKMYRNLIEAI